MYFHGSFINQQGRAVTVHILTGADRTQTVEIGAEGGDVFFTEDPVEITSEVNDTFGHLLRHSASVRLLTREYIGAFFSNSCFDAVVNIYLDGRCIFAGYIEPQTYSQGYNEVYDELELNCIDALSALQYCKFKNIGALGVSYDVEKTEARTASFGQILSSILTKATAGLDITGGNEVRCLYDGSKSISSEDSARYAIFDKIGIPELLFLGAEEDDVWQLDEVAEEIMRYLNLHLVQEGFDFYIFSWETVKGQTSTVWCDIAAEPPANWTRTYPRVTLSNETAADTDTQINIGETYNQILLTCKVESVENVIESPLDDDLLTSPYVHRQKYMTEYSADGEGVTALRSFVHQIRGQGTYDYDKGVITDWYIQVMGNPLWTFPEHGYGEDIIAKYCSGGLNQQKVPNELAAYPGAAIVAMGSVRASADPKDNSPVSKIEMQNYLVVSVNGNGKDKAGEAYPGETTLANTAPRAVYKGNTSGGVFSPADTLDTNYIVLSGNIILNPLMEFTAPYSDLYQLTYDQIHDQYWHKTVPCRDNGDGRYYTQQFFKALTPSATPSYDTGIDYGLTPFTGTGPELYEFTHSAVGDSTDTISKVAALACMLIIGDKCVVETGSAGKPSDFEWKPYKTKEQCADLDEYYSQCFTIGFDPKIGDKLIGSEFAIQNNISFDLGIDAEGTAIPIKKSDKVSGPVQFLILGPVNTTWDVITRRHKTWFRHTKWSATSVPLLAHVSNILLKSFEVKVYSDNGRLDAGDGGDIVYMSDTRETFINRKDDIEFKINTALSSAECRKLGVSASVNLASPVDMETGENVREIYDRSRALSAKPEQLYVDSYYTEYRAPRILMTTKLLDIGTAVNMFARYIHPALPGREFYVQGLGRNLMSGEAEMTLKEVW